MTRRSLEEAFARMTARVNFILNTHHQHGSPTPEWVLDTLKGDNPPAELSDSELPKHIGLLLVQPSTGMRWYRG
jgi:hypothetical protein